jgi:hypothetical protein
MYVRAPRLSLIGWKDFIYNRNLSVNLSQIGKYENGSCKSTVSAFPPNGSTCYQLHPGLSLVLFFDLDYEATCPPKRLLTSYGLYGVIYQKTELMTTTTTMNETYLHRPLLPARVLIQDRTEEPPSRYAHTHPTPEICNRVERTLTSKQEAVNSSILDLEEITQRDENYTHN